MRVELRVSAIAAYVDAAELCGVLGPGGERHHGAAGGGAQLGGARLERLGELGLGGVGAGGHLLAGRQLEERLGVVRDLQARLLAQALHAVHQLAHQAGAALMGTQTARSRKRAEKQS